MRMDAKEAMVSWRVQTTHGASRALAPDARIVHRQSSIINLSGFTLIELLVVIAIMALLMAILLPVLGRARSQAKALRCRANLKQWGQVLALYTSDNEGRFPFHHPDAIWLLRGATLSEDDPCKPEVWHGVYTQGIARCPVANKTGEAHTLADYDASYGPYPTRSVTVMTGSTFDAWEIIRPGPPFLCSYGFSRWLLSGTSGSPGRAVFSVRGAANMPALLDCTEPGGKPREQDAPPPDPSKLIFSEMTRFCRDRHNGHVNAVFLDSSAREIGLKELWTLKWHPNYNTAGPWTKAGDVQPEAWPEWMRRFKDY